MATWTSTSVGQPVAQPIIQQLINDIPAQSTEVVYHEFKTSREIIEDVQRGTITIQYMIQGTPDEAWRSAGLAGFARGDVHPWYDYGFLVHRSFKHAAMNDTTAGSWTLATFVYQQRPCLSLYEEDFNIALVGYQTWYSYDNIPKPMDGGQFVGINVLYPQIIYRRHWPRVKMQYSLVTQLYESVGTTNGHRDFSGPNEQFDPFLGHPDGFWLIDGVQAKLLYGRTNPEATEDTYWEITIVFRGDPWRHHEHWYLGTPEQGYPRPQNNEFNSMAAAHIRRKVYRPANVKFADLVPISSEGCTPPRAG